MIKKTLKTIATNFEETNQEFGVESIHFCQMCKTMCNAEIFASNENVCVFCFKKKSQFEKIKVFTFKPSVYFFHKVGTSKNELEDIEYEQMIFGMKTNFIEYNYNNMVWYIYNKTSSDKLYKTIFVLYDFYKKIQVANNSNIKNSTNKFKHMFDANTDYISLELIISDLTSFELSFSKFLPRDRFFI